MRSQKLKSKLIQGNINLSGNYKVTSSKYHYSTKDMTLALFHIQLQACTKRSVQISFLEAKLNCFPSIC